MFGVIPVSGELIGSSHKDGVALDGQGFGRLEPGLEGLIGEFLTRAIKEAFPNFCGAERHDTLPYAVYVEKSNQREENPFI